MTNQTAILTGRDVLGGPDDVETSLANLPCTDAGQGEAIALLFGDELRYDHAASRWLTWDGIRWQPDRQGNIPRYAVDTARKRRSSSSLIFDEGQQKRFLQWNRAAENLRGINAALKLASCVSPITTSGELFDQNGWLLACSNGVIDLHTGSLLPGCQEDLISHSTNIAYDPDATCPRWESFLSEIFPGDSDLIRFIQRAVGYTLTGEMTEQCLFVCQGTGANGKSVFLSTLQKILGEYSTNTPFDTLLDHGKMVGGIPNDVAALNGARLVTASEANSGVVFNEGRIKALTGGDQVTARFLNQEFFMFKPTAKIWLATNHKPVIQGTDEAIWRRIRLIPFETHFSGEDVDRDLTAKLAKEAPGILAWAVRGCLDWQQHGLPIPQSILQASREYRHESDWLSAFLQECTVQGGNGTSPVALIYEVYRTWSIGRGDQPVTMKRLSKELKERGIISKHMRDASYYPLSLLCDEVMQ